MVYKNSQNEIIYVDSSSLGPNVRKEDVNKLIVEVKKSYFSKELYPQIIDTNFTQLVKTKSTKSLATFFEEYENIKELIPLISPSASHQYLMEEGIKYTNQIVDITEKPGAE